MPKTALIVDDDALFQAAIGDGLRAAGYAVTVAANGLEALEMVRESPPDFILLDLIMPKLDGTRTCKILKGHPQHRAIPIIVLTGLGAEGRSALDGLGAEAVVAKRQAELTLADILKTLERLESSRAGTGPSAEPAPDMPPRRIVSELLAERRHTQTLLATLGEGVVELDDRGRVVYSNAAALAMLDRTEDAILGGPGAELLGAANAPALERGLREVLAEGEGRTVRLDLPHGDKTIGVTLTALPRPEGPPGALLVLRDLTNLTRQARGLQALAAVDQHILGKADLGAVLRKIVTRTAELLGVERCGLFRLERTSDQLRFRCIQGLGLSEHYAREVCLAPGQGAVGKAVEERRAVYTSDLLRDPALRIPAEMRTLLQQEGIEAVLAAPILLPDEAYGTLTVYRPAGYRFTPEEVELVSSLAGSAAIAIENARLFQEEQERRRQLEAVRAVTAEITRELDLTTLLELIHRRAAELVGAASGTVYLWDEAAQALIPQAWHGRGEWMRNVRFRLGEGLVGTVAQRREGMILNDYRSWPQASPLILERDEFTAMLAEPLVYRDRLLGVITLNNRATGRPFRAQDRELLSLLSAQAALAIENARLFGEVSRGKTEWENTFDSISDLVAVLDMEGRIVRANRTLLRRLGRPLERVLRQTCTDLFGDDGAAWGGCPHQRAVRQEGPVGLEVEDARLGGSYAVSVFPVRDAEGQILGTVHIARDITEQKAIHAKLSQADKLASIGTLAAGVAHSINNVLAGIVARADLLLVSAADPETHRSAEVILQAAMDGAETVRRMREFTRIEPSGAVGLVSLNGAVRDALELTETRWRDEAQAHGAPITVETRLEAAAPIEGNVAEIREVLVNLILNAVDAMPGGGCLRIATADRPGPPPAVPGARSAGVLEVRVEDTGVGMSEPVRRRIFDPFFTTKGVAGTGLGLSVSYGLVAKHQGEIAVRSREGEGTTFVLTFPVAAAGDGRGTAPASTSPPRRGRVLLIEDGSNLREAMAEGLVQAGHQVEVVAGGREGIERFRNGAFDVVLTDLGMPEVSGLDVARAVKEADPSAYVILCTGWGKVPGAEVPLRERGVDALLAKPFRMDEVDRAIRAGLQARAPVPA
jgi:PAS domain S-box-containing protein